MIEKAKELLATDSWGSFDNMPERIAYPVICSRCHRKSVDAKDRLKKCGLPQPDGTRCTGIFVPRDAVKE